MRLTCEINVIAILDAKSSPSDTATFLGLKLAGVVYLEANKSQSTIDDSW